MGHGAGCLVGVRPLGETSIEKREVLQTPQERGIACGKLSRKLGSVNGYPPFVRPINDASSCPWSHFSTMIGGIHRRVVVKHDQDDYMLLGHVIDVDIGKQGT